MISYRRPAVEEAAALAQLHVQCWQEAYTPLVPAEVSARFSSTAMLPTWQEHLSDDKRFVLAAYAEGQAVGLINEGAPVAPLFDGMDGRVAALYVRQSHHRRGIGSKLLGAAARHHLMRDGRSLCLGVLAANQQARSFYEALGARLVKQGLFTWHGHDLPELTLLFEDLPRLAAIGDF